MEKPIINRNDIVMSLGWFGEMESFKEIIAEHPIITIITIIATILFFICRWILYLLDRKKT